MVAIYQVAISNGTDLPSVHIVHKKTGGVEVALTIRQISIGNFYWGMVPQPTTKDSKRQSVWTTRTVTNCKSNIILNTTHKYTLEKLRPLHSWSQGRVIITYVEKNWNWIKLNSLLNVGLFAKMYLKI